MGGGGGNKNVCALFSFIKQQQKQTNKKERKKKEKRMDNLKGKQSEIHALLRVKHVNDPLTPDLRSAKQKNILKNPAALARELISHKQNIFKKK